MRTLLISIAAGALALTAFGIVVVIGTAGAVEATGYVVGIGALTDMTALGVIKAIKRRSHW